jgi:hypothetical protein
MMFRISLLVFLGASAVLTSAGLRAPAPAPVVSHPQGDLRETFEQTYPLAPGGRVSLENFTGIVQVTTWDRPEVKVSAVKRADSPERLAEAEIEVTPGPAELRIVSRYARQNLRWSNKEHERAENSARVDYALTVPRTARLDKLELHNGEIRLEGLAGAVVVSTLNGGVTARALTGDLKVSTLNGRIEADFGEMSADQRVSLSSLNGQIVVSLASDDVRLTAGTMHGRLSNALGRTASTAPGWPHVDISNINGDITVRRASSGLR